MHRILAIGAATVLALALSREAAAWSWQADGAVVRSFALGADVYAAGQHRGIDVAGPDGSAVKAPAAGVVSFSGSLPTYGRGVTIVTADGYAVTLVHLGTIEIAKGATVGEGDTVGTMGVSGTPEQEGPSVHLGIRRASDDEGYVDPLGLLPPRAAPAPAPSPAPEAAAAPVSAPAPVTVRPPSPPAPSPVVAPAQAPAPAAPPSVTGTAPAVAATAAPAASSVTSPVASPGSETPPSVVAVQPTAAEGGVTVSRPHMPAVAPAAGNTGGRVALDAPVRSAAPFHVGTSAHRSGPVSTHPASEATLTPTVVGVRTHQAVGRQVHVMRASATDSEILRPTVHQPSHPAEAPRPAHKTLTRGVAPERANLGRSATRAVVRERPVTVATDATASPSVSQPARSARREPPGAVGGVGIRGLVAGIAFLALLAAAVGRQVARRIGMDGAVLRHHADLLRQLDAAHRPRLHDRGRGRVRSPSAAART